MNKDFFRALRLSTLLHILAPLVMLAIMIFFGGEGQGNAKKKLTGQNVVEFKPKTIDIEIEDVRNKKTIGIKKIKPKHLKDKCDNFYGGIGITVDSMLHPLGDQVAIVAPTYPAHSAGLQPGDVILEPHEEIKGEIGTEVTLKILKVSGETQTITFVRDKICIITKKP